MKHDSGTEVSGVGAPRRKSIIALIASFAMLCIGLVGIVAAPAASAHNSTLNGSVACEKDQNNKNTGKYVFTWTLPADPGYPATATASGAITDNTAKALTATWSATFNSGASQTLNTHITWQDGYSGNRDDSKTLSSSQDCSPPVTYTYSAQKTAQKTICLNGVTSTVSATGDTISQTKDTPFTQPQKDAIDAQAQTSANNALTTKLNTQYQGWQDGACKNTYTATAVQLSKTICVDGVTKTIQVTGDSVTVGPQEQPITKEQKDAADAAAAASAQSKMNAELAKPANAGWVNGKCANTYSVTKTASADACVDGAVKTFTASSTVNLQAQEQPFTQKQKDDAAALAQSQADADLAKQLKDAGAVKGQCKATAQRSGEITICADDPVEQDALRAIETRTVSWQTAVYQAEGATTAQAQAAADALADAAVPAAKAAALAPYPNFTDGACKDSTTYGASRGASGSMTICYAGKTYKVDWSGSASVSGKATQDEANTQAQNDAQKAADADKKNKLDAFPGYTQGECAPASNTSPVVAPQPAKVPAKVPVKKPVAAPQPGTVPAAVPAGGGSSAPQQGLPTWAVLVMVAGAAGAAFSIKRLASQR